MVNGYIISSTVFAIAFILLGLLTLSRNPKSKLNRLFLFFSINMAVWLVTNFLAGSATVPYAIALLSNKLVFFFSGASIFALLAFVKEITGRTYTRPEKLLSITTPFLLLCCLTNLVVKDIYVDSGIYAITFGPLANFYFLLLIALTVAAIRNLLMARKHASTLLRSQIDTIVISFGLALVGVITTNALFPFVLNYYGLTNAGSFFSIFFVGGAAYAIVKHKLFDIRLIVARSVAYTGIVSLLALIYGTATYIVTSFLLHGQSNQIVEGSINVGLIILSAVSFAPLKRAFDRITNRIFYRDAYDSQVLLDEFNKVLVSTIDLDILLRRAAEKIAEHIRPDYCVIGVQKTNESPRYMEGTAEKAFDENDLNYFISVSPLLSSTVVSADFIDEQDDRLRQVMTRNDVYTIARLKNTTDDGDPDLGYIVLGAKKSGNIYSKQDLAVLEILANELVIAVQNALRFEEIEKFNVTLQQKIEQATRQLQRNNEKLKAMDETKDEFISMASHQLRTPLTSVKGYLSMVLEGDAGELTDMQRKLLDQAFISSQRMVYLIADLLNVSRLHTGKFIIDAAPASLADVIESETQQLEKTATGRGLVLSYKKPRSFPLLMLDETKIRQVVMNFLDNAIYYSKPGGHIEIILTHTDDSVEFKVVDDGIGVPKHEQPQLFNKFYRAGNAKKARPDGTGLGLFMAKKVVVAQGGSIVFKSEEGKGSTFGFTFGKAKLLPPITTPSK